MHLFLLFIVANGHRPTTILGVFAISVGYLFFLYTYGEGILALPVIYSEEARACLLYVRGNLGKAAEAAPLAFKRCLAKHPFVGSG